MGFRPTQPERLGAYAGLGAAVLLAAIVLVRGVPLTWSNLGVIAVAVIAAVLVLTIRARWAVGMALVLTLAAAVFPILSLPGPLLLPALLGYGFGWSRRRGPSPESARAPGGRPRLSR